MGVSKAVKGILKKGASRSNSKKRSLAFDKVINYIQEFDEDLPVLSISQPGYRAPPGDDNDIEVLYWWEEEEEVIPWYEMEDENETQGYNWDDVTEKKHAKFRTNAMDGLLDKQQRQEWSEASVTSSDNDDDDSSSSSSSSYDEETISDVDDDYQQVISTPSAGVQLDVAAMQAEMSVASSPPPVKKEPILKEEPAPSPSSARAKSEGSETSLATSEIIKPSPKRSIPRRTSRSGSFVAVSKEELFKQLMPPKLDPSPPKPAEEKPAEEEKPKPEAEKPKPEAVTEPPPPSAVIKEPVKRPSSAPDPTPRKEEPKKDQAQLDDAKKQKEEAKKERRSSGGLPNNDKRTSDGSKKKAKKRRSDPKIKLHIQPVPRPADDKDEQDPEKYAWEKPDWTKENKLKQTKKGHAVRKGADLAKPITMINRVKNDMADAKLMSFGKPKWMKKSEILKQTDTGDHLKTGGSLASKITHIASDPRAQEKYGWQKPEWATKKILVKETEEGEKLKKGEYLSKGITHINEDQEAKEKYAWAKPEWAQKKVLSKSKAGEKMKKGEYLSTGITNNEQAKEKYQWEKPDWAKKETTTATASATATGGRQSSITPDTRQAKAPGAKGTPRTLPSNGPRS